MVINKGLYLPSDGLQDFVWSDKIFHSHLHNRPVSGDDLFVEGIAKIDPQIFTVLVQISESEIVFFQNPKRLTYL